MFMEAKTKREISSKRVGRINEKTEDATNIQQFIKREEEVLKLLTAHL